MKLFNKERFKFIEGKRLKNYLVYAFGEIILVVVGILIAVSINNYSNTANLNEVNEALRLQVIKNLENDILKISRFQDKLEALNQDYLAILGRSNDTSQETVERLTVTLPFKIEVLSLRKSTMNLIDNAELNTSRAATVMLNLSNTYKVYLANISDVEAVIFEAMSDNLKGMEQTQDWYVAFVTDFKCGSDCYSYLATDKGHKARMASLRFLYDDHYSTIIDGFKNDLESYLDVLKASSVE